MATMKVQLNRLRIAPQKVRLVADAIRGNTISEARIQLSAMEKRSAEPMAKLLESGVANAVHNLGFNVDNLYIEELYVGEGMTLKRWLPRAHGRATKLLKRTSHITMVLAEIEEGVGRTEPEQKKRMEVMAQKTEVSAKREEESADRKLGAAQSTPVVSTKKMGTVNAQKQKMFRRKSS